MRLAPSSRLAWPLPACRPLPAARARPARCIRPPECRPSRAFGAGGSGMTLRTTLLVLTLSAGGLQSPAGAQTRTATPMETVRVRYMVKELDPAVAFYTKYLGFQVEQQARPN